MALVVKDRVRVTTTTTGTTDFTLGGAVTGYQSFSVIGNGNQTYYAAQDPATGDWEVGIGTYSSTGPTLSRDTILESSNAGSKVVFAAGSKDVFCTYPAERSVYLDVAGSYPVQSTFNTITATTATLTNGTITTTPTSANDIANKTYVDTIASSGITYHTPVKYEVPDTTGNLNATYNNGTGGVGATLTNAGTKAAFAPDGPTAQVGDRILVYNQTNQYENGVYEVTTVGTPDPGGTNWVLTRTSDTNSYGVKDPNKLGNGDAFFITSGNTGAGETYVCNTTGTITFGTTAITFVQVSDATLYTAGTGLTLTGGTQFNIANTGVVAATYGSASTVPVIAVNAQGQITSATNTSIAITAGAVSGLAASATTDTTNAANISSGTLNSARLSGSYTGITGVGTLTAGTWNASTISVPYGGTGITSYAVGDLIYANTTTSLAKLPDVATGNVLLSGGVGTAPAWGKVGLTTHVSGTLAVSNGGTGATTLTGYVKGNGTSAFTASATIPNADTTATSANTANAIVARDASGNFSAGTITASLSGNATSATSATSATTATNLAGGTAGALPYQSGSGTTLFTAAGTAGQYLQSNGTSAPSWTTFPTIGNGTLTLSVSGTGLSGSASFTANQSGNTTFTVTSNATSANTASTIVARDASGNFSAGTITASLSGNATSATSATSAGSVTNSVTFNNGGSGDASGTSFNGSAARTISYNTVGASPLAGSASLTTTGTVTSGTWSASFGAVSGANLTNLTAGNLTGTIPSAVLGNSSLNVGTTSIALNRASANQALTGISSVTFPGATSGTIQLIPAATAGTGTVLTMPATTGTVITSGDTGTVTNTMLAGSIANNKLTNSSITINSASTALGGSVTLYAGTTTLQTSSANQALTGISSVTFPGSSSGSVQLIAAAAAGTGTVLTMPATTGTILTTGAAVTVAQGGTGITSGTSGGVPYFSSTSTIASSAALAANALVVGGGAGAAPSTITTGTGVVTALGVNTGTAGAFVVNGGALGTPLSGTLTNATGLPLSTGVTGTLPVANGGTGQTSYTDGQLLIGNTATGGLTKATLTAGSGISITNGNGSISIAASVSPTLTISNKTGAYTVVSGDNGTIINCTSGTFTVALTAAASLGSGFNCWVWNTGTGVITIDPNAAETIDGVSTLVLQQGEGAQIVCNGTNWETGDRKDTRMYAENAPATMTRPTASGSQSFAIGESAVASGAQSIAINTGSTASAQWANAIGRNTTASSFGSTALGSNSAGSGSQAVSGSGAMALGGSYASGTNSFAAAIADNSSTYGAKGANAIAIGRNANSTSTSSLAIGDTTTASSSYALALGYSATASVGNYTTAIGTNSGGFGSVATTNSSAMALGGSYASGLESFAAAIGNNTSSYGATNSNSIAIGQLARASGSVATALGRRAEATGTYSIAISAEGSDWVTASGLRSVAIGNSQTEAQQAYGVAIGNFAVSRVVGKYVYSAYRNLTAGDMQTGTLILTASTTGAVATVLTSDTNAAGSTNQVILPNNSAYAFSALIVARRQASGGTASAAWRIEGLIRREGTAASTTLVNSATTVLDNTPGWTIAVSADTTNGGLAITATGAAATNIRWVATVQTSEVTYA